MQQEKKEEKRGSKPVRLDAGMGCVRSDAVISLLLAVCLPLCRPHTVPFYYGYATCKIIHISRLFYAPPVSFLCVHRTVSSFPSLPLSLSVPPYEFSWVQAPFRNIVNPSPRPSAGRASCLVRWIEREAASKWRVR